MLWFSPLLVMVPLHQFVVHGPVTVSQLSTFLGRQVRTSLSSSRIVSYSRHLSNPPVTFHRIIVCQALLTVDRQEIIEPPIATNIDPRGGVIIHNATCYCPIVLTTAAVCPHAPIERKPYVADQQLSHTVSITVRVLDDPVETHLPVTGFGLERSFR